VEKNSVGVSTAGNCFNQTGEVTADVMSAMRRKVGTKLIRWICANKVRMKMSFRMKREFSNTLDEAKAEAQRLFDEWMGGLFL
jgi:hypothetical protein